MKKAEATKLKILRTGFELMYQHGYQATSIDEISRRAGITKGAFYYYFKTKDEMGLSIIDQLIEPIFMETFNYYLQTFADPTESIYNLFHHLLMGNKFLHGAYGCPVSNLIQEMAPSHPQFSVVLFALTQKWEHAIVKVLETGKDSGFIRADIEPKRIASFVVSGYWGIRNFGKLAGGNSVYSLYLAELRNYLCLLK